MIDLYKNIKKRREDLEMTQSQLAEKAGYADKSMIAKIEKGLVEPLKQSEKCIFYRGLRAYVIWRVIWALKIAPGSCYTLRGLIKCGAPLR